MYKLCLGYITLNPIFTCPACVQGGSKRLSKKVANANVHSDGPTRKLRRCSCVDLSTSGVSVEVSIDPLPPCEHEESSLADICFGDLLISSELPQVDPNGVESGFQEPDGNHASIAFACAALSPSPSAGEEAVRNFCMVYKCFPLKSEIASSPEAQDSVAKELNTMEDLSVWDT